MLLFGYFYIHFWTKKVKATTEVGSGFWSFDWYCQPQYQFFAKVYAQMEGREIGICCFREKKKVLIADPNIIKDVLVRNFDHFSNRQNVFFNEKEPMTMHLFNLPERLWRG